MPFTKSPDAIHFASRRTLLKRGAIAAGAAAMMPRLAPAAAAGDAPPADASWSRSIGP